MFKKEVNLLIAMRSSNCLIPFIKDNTIAWFILGDFFLFAVVSVKRFNLGFFTIDVCLLGDELII